MPSALRRLLRLAFQAVSAEQETVDAAYLADLLSLIPVLRGFAISLLRSTDGADDLVQETLLKALAQPDLFQRGTNLRAWLFTILRNLRSTQARKGKREIEDRDGIFASMLTVPAEQMDKLIHREMSAAFEKLPGQYREILTMIVIDGLSYEHAAAQSYCAVGTVISRMYRARTAWGSYGTNGG